MKSVAQKRIDEEYMRLCLELARKGAGHVSPNPLVGCVIVKKGKIIGLGWHKKFGEAHAEVNAISSAVESVTGATAYVNLEPHSHKGKTPPCTDLLIEKKIARVVIGTRDINVLVNGKGIRKLKSAGIEVTEDVLEHESREINKFFFHWMETKLPYVTLKLAQTIDGKISDAKGKQAWISAKESQKYVHQLRSEYDAVLIGSGTYLIDKPMLTVRHVKGRNPVRVILDSKLRGEYGRKFLSAKVKTIIFTSVKAIQTKKGDTLMKKGVTLIAAPRTHGGLELAFVLRTLGSMGIASVLVEGGNAITTSFITHNLANELLLFIAPKLFGKGVPAFGGRTGMSAIPASFPNLTDVTAEQIGEDILIKGVFRK
jgi:diaminohydroxyphosphoribosylaminopyrimidine deaminase/5-amino-6-(5-phosphoribosylamino)uracil reductase